jgi:hypothetical protein
VAFALTLRAPEDDLHRIRASADHENLATGVSPVRNGRSFNGRAGGRA